MITGLFLCLVLEINRTALFIYAIILEYNERISNMSEAPTLKELLDTRKENHATSIIISTTNNKKLFKGKVSELPEKLLNLPIFEWNKRDGSYITIE